MSGFVKVQGSPYTIINNNHFNVYITKLNTRVSAFFEALQ